MTTVLLGIEMSIAYITEDSQARRILADLSTEPVLGLDIETTGLDPHTARIRLIQVATRAGHAVVFDMAQVAPGCLAPLFALPLVAHNAAFEYSFLKYAGLPVGRLHDTMLMGRLTRSTIGCPWRAYQRLFWTLIWINLSKRRTGPGTCRRARLNTPHRTP